MWYVIWFSIIVIVGLAIVFGSLAFAAFLEARLDTAKLPRKEMFWCYKHGLFPREDCLHLDAMNALTEEPGIECCPKCWWERYKGAEQEAYR